MRGLPTLLHDDGHDVCASLLFLGHCSTLELFCFRGGDDLSMPGETRVPVLLRNDRSVRQTFSDDRQTLSNDGDVSSWWRYCCCCWIGEGLCAPTLVRRGNPAFRS